MRGRVGGAWAGEESGAALEPRPPPRWRGCGGVGGGVGPGQGSDSRPVFCTPDESSEEEDEDDEREDEAAGGYRLGSRERALSPGLEESGLGLLARCAASALPSPTVGPSLSVVQLEAKQKARKKEERQSLMGESRWWAAGRRVPLPGLQVGLKQRTGTLPLGPGRGGRPGGGATPLAPACRSLGRGLQSCAVTFTVDAPSRQDLGRSVSGSSGVCRGLGYTPWG